MVCVCALFSLTGCYNTEPRESVLKIYNWADYIDEDMLAEFPRWYKEQTGEDIRIVYQTFDINEIMLTKIERGHEDFDVVCPSEYIIERMLRKGLLLPIDTVFGKTLNYLHNSSLWIESFGSFHLLPHFQDMLLEALDVTLMAYFLHTLLLHPSILAGMKTGHKRSRPISSYNLPVALKYLLVKMFRSCFLFLFSYMT